jgi:hypothetical protein
MTQMRTGRPTKYNSQYCSELIDHMALGFSFESFAGKIDVCEDTLFEWLKQHEDFSESYKHARAKCRIFWEELGIVGTTEGKNFNATTWVFNMKNRFRWTDRQDVTTGGEKLDSLVIVTNESCLK